MTRWEWIGAAMAIFLAALIVAVLVAGLLVGLAWILTAIIEVL